MIPNEPKVTPQLVAEHGLTPDEYERILPRCPENNRWQNEKGSRSGVQGER